MSKWKVGGAVVLVVGWACRWTLFRADAYIKLPDRRRRPTTCISVNLSPIVCACKKNYAIYTAREGPWMCACGPIELSQRNLHIDK